MATEPQEVIVNANELEWKPLGVDAWAKVLHVCPETGSWSVLLKQAKGSVVPPHKHLAPAEFYVLEGTVEYRGGVAKTGYFAREPIGAVHEKTSFPEDTVYYFKSYGPLAMYDDAGNIAYVTDWQGMAAVRDS